MGFGQSGPQAAQGRPGTIQGPPGRAQGRPGNAQGLAQGPPRDRTGTAQGPAGGLPKAAPALLPCPRALPEPSRSCSRPPQRSQSCPSAPRAAPALPELPRSWPGAALDLHPCPPKAPRSCQEPPRSCPRPDRACPRPPQRPRAVQSKLQDDFRKSSLRFTTQFIVEKATEHAVDAALRPPCPSFRPGAAAAKRN